MGKFEKQRQDALAELLGMSDKELYELHFIYLGGEGGGKKKIAEQILTRRRTEEITGALSSLQKTIEESSKASTQLGNKVFWLTVVLAVAALLTAGVSACDLYFKLPS